MIKRSNRVDFTTVFRERSMKPRRNWRALFVATGLVATSMALVSAPAFSTRTSELYGHAGESTVQSPSASLPVGTILPVRLDKTLAADEAQAGQEIEGEIMQDVPLQDREKIHANSRVSGTIVSVAQAAGGAGTQVSLRFDKIDNHGEIISMLTRLRAIASDDVVNSALQPLNSGNDGSPSGWASTALIGGDVRYGDGGEVLNRQKQKVGKGVSGGVLVHVTAQPGSGCDGPINGDDSAQALWVFSSDACGVYGLPGIEVPHDGKTAPLGVITLRFEGSKTKLEAFAGMLLRVLAPQQPLRL
jgi:hypothetical protein